MAVAIQVGVWRFSVCSSQRVEMVAWSTGSGYVFAPSNLSRRAWQLPSTSTFSSSIALRISGTRRFCLTPLSAKRKSAGGETGVDHAELDPDLREGLNEVSNEALKVMLSDDDKLVSSFKEKVDYLGEYLTHEGQLDAAKFMMVIKGMLDHEVYPQIVELKGPYKQAFAKIWSVVEDSGWLLKPPGADTAGVEMVDDELIPPVLNTHY